MTGIKSEAGLKKTPRDFGFGKDGRDFKITAQARMIKEEPEELRPRDTKIKRKKKSTSYDRLKIIRKKNAERQRMKRAQMSEEEKERERATNAEQARKRRALKAEGQVELRSKSNKLNRPNKLSKEARFQELRSKDAELKRKKRAEMTEEEKNELRAKWAEVQRKKRAALSEEERKLKRAQWAEEKRRKRALMSKEEKKKINAKKSQRLKVKENETTDQRLRRLISLTGVHVNKNPDRYKLVGGFIKNAFCDIRDIYSEVGNLKNNLKLCVARAAEHAIRLHRREKQRKAGYESKMFMEISPSMDPKNHTQNQLHASVNETDPLFGEAAIKSIKTETFEMTDENAADDFNFEDFTLFTHDSPSTFEKSTAEKIDCTMCSKKFATSMGLMIHQKSHKPNRSEFKCCVCPQIFSTYNSMTDHFLQVHSFQITCINDEDKSSEKCINKIESSEKCINKIESSEKCINKIDSSEKCINKIESSEKCIKKIESSEKCINKIDSSEKCINKIESSEKCINKIESSEKCIDEIEERSKHEFDFFYSGQCSVCDKTFDKTIFGLGMYSAHIISDHGENKDLFKYFTYICSLCETPHTTLRLLKTHWITNCLENWKSENNKDNKIVCENCGMQFENETSLSSHSKIFHKLKTRVFCEQCGSSFSRNKTLKQHIEVAHQGGPTIPCEYCEERFQSIHLLRKHSMNVHSVKKSYSCSFCEQSFPKRRFLQEHTKLVHPLEQNRFPCEKCNQIFRRKEYLHKHKKRGHCEERELKTSTIEIEAEVTCTFCDLTFPKQMFLKEHFKTVHPGEEFRPYACKSCDQKFKRKDTLLRHTQRIHLGQKFKKTSSKSKTAKKFECSYCGKSFRSKDSYDYHVNTHTGEKPYKCKYCQKGFAARPALTMHEGIHEGFSCKICGESFSCYYDLGRHRQITHPDSTKSETKEEVQALPISNLELICDVCGKTFAGYLCLDAHKRYTHGEKKFVCDICGNSYNRPSSLRKHRYSHDTLQRFGCTLCDKTFVRPEKFYKHRAKAHKKDIEYPKIVKLIPDDKFLSRMKTNNSTNASNIEKVNKPQKALEEHSNTLPTNIQTSLSAYVEHHLPELLDASNVSWEQGNSPDAGHYSPEMELDHEEIVNDIGIPQNRNTELQNKTLHTPCNIGRDSTFNYHSVFGAITEVRHSDHSSNFIDFSRANVPSVPAILTTEKKPTNVAEKKNEHTDNISLIVHDEKEASTADIDIKKIKTEAPAYTTEDTSSVASNQNDSDIENEFQTEDIKNKIVSFPQDPYSPFLMVTLSRLLEHKCVPCEKSIFAISQREIRQHSRSHRSKTIVAAAKRILSNKKTKRKYVKGASKRKPVPANGVSKRESVPIHGVFKINVFDCSYCEKKNFSAISIMSHCHQAHPGLKPVKCPKCPKMFNCVNSYYNHKKKRHNPPKPKKPIDPNAKKEAICEVCGKAFRTKQQVYVHKSQQHSGKTFPCTVCSRSFLQKGNLENHIKRLHSGSDEGKTHLCEECGKAYFTPSELKIHVNVVHRKIANYRKYFQKRRDGETTETHSYPCLVCPHQAVTEKGLQKHMRVHNPERTYVCAICGWRYAHYNYLMSHRQVTHKIFGPRSKKAKANFLA